MTLPLYWRRASFSVSETAALAGVSEDTLRTWLARNPVNDFNGIKTGSRIYLSGQDAVFFALVKLLTAFGVPVRVAMLSATPIVSDMADAMPPYEFLVVHTDDGVSDFTLTDKPVFSDRAALVIPVRAVAEDLIDRATIVYATDEAGPKHKIGTVDGYPIDEWRAGIEAELARMPVNK